MSANPNPSRARIQHLLRGNNRGKIVQAYFGEEQQSAMGGLPLLSELEAAEGLMAGAAAVLRDWRAPGQITFPLEHLLAQRTLLICAGREDGNDSTYYANDPALNLALSLCLGVDEAVRLASQPTISRFENGIGTISCYLLAMFLIGRYISLKKKPPKDLRLDFDGSCVPTRGNQQHTAYRKYYNTTMYFPLFVFDQDGFLITTVLRPGSDGEAALTVPVLKRLVLAFRSAWPNVEITVVMDAAFNDPKIYDWCEDNHVYYLIKLKAAGKPAGGLYGKSDNYARAAKIAFAKKHGAPKYLDSDTTKCSLESQIRELPKAERKKELKELARRKIVRYFEFEHRTGICHRRHETAQ